MATTMLTDMASASMPLAPPPSADSLASFQRNWFGKLLTGTYEADYEDYLRSEQSANNAFMRDLAIMREGNEFNASQAELDRAFQREMADTQYLRASKQMKQLGINPVMMLNQLGGSASPQGAQAYSSSARSSGSNYRHSVGDSSDAIVGTILSVIGKFLLGKFLPSNGLTINNNFSRAVRK